VDNDTNGLEPADWFDPPVDDLAEESVVDRAPVEVALTEIKEMLGLTDLQLEAATGISRTTFWRMRTQRTADTRSVTEAPIWRLHALGRVLVDRMGRESVKGWLHSGTPSPISRLESGDVAGVEAAADKILFPDPAIRRSSAAVADDDFAAVVTRPEGSTDSPRARRVRRRRNDQT
jgi:hypothetical protein